MQQHSMERGQSMVEVALILALAVTVTIIMLVILGVRLRDIYCTVVDAVGSKPIACEGVLFEEPFASLDAWTFPVGNGWEQQDGQLCNERGGEHRAMAGDASWDDYRVSVDNAEMGQGNGYGVYFRTTEPEAVNGYVFQYDPGYRGAPYPNGAFLIRKVVNGSETSPIAVQAAPPGYEWNDVNRQVEVDVKGDTFTAYIDGEPVVTAQDSQFQNGGIGLRTWNGTQACFDNITVRRN